MNVITPADAFRLLLSARYRKSKLKFADNIDARWLTYPERLAGRFVASNERIPRSVTRSANEAIQLLRDRVKAGSIRLRGELHTSEPPADIDPQDCLRGELDVFGQTLSVYARARDIKAARVYRFVSCVKSDVLKIADEISKQPAASEPALKKATPPILRDAIAAVYDAAAKAGTKPPNIIELPAAVQPRLKTAGYEASGRQIKEIGSEPRFKHRRLAPGQDLA
jgi:hypothetical protein